MSGLVAGTEERCLMLVDGRIVHEKVVTAGKFVDFPVCDRCRHFDMLISRLTKSRHIPLIAYRRKFLISTAAQRARECLVWMCEHGIVRTFANFRDIGRTVLEECDSLVTMKLHIRRNRWY